MVTLIFLIIGVTSALEQPRSNVESANAVPLAGKGFDALSGGVDHRDRRGYNTRWRRAIALQAETLPREPFWLNCCVYNKSMPSFPETVYRCAA